MLVKSFDKQGFDITVCSGLLKILLKFNIPRLYYSTHYYSLIECQPFLSSAEVIQEARFAQYGKKT